MGRPARRRSDRRSDWRSHWHTHWRAFCIAGRLLTRLPFPDPGPTTPGEAGRAVAWYPLIGWLLGVPLALIASLLAPVDPELTAALVLILWVWGTGGLHLDGLADSADAWVGGLGNRERMLAIMKDPCSGPVGVTAIVLTLIAKWSALSALCGAGEAWALAWVTLIARAQLPLLLRFTPYARPEGMAAAATRHLTPRATGLSVGLAAAATVLALGPLGVVLLASMAAGLVLARRALIARLGGFTGDTAGALVELGETLLLMLAAGLLTWQGAPSV